MKFRTSQQPAEYLPFREVIRIARAASGRKSPVRYLNLGGDVPRARTGCRWSPTAVSGCVRRAVYKVCGVPEDPDCVVPESTAELFERGTVAGAWMAAYALAAEGHEGITDVRCQAGDRQEMLVRDEGLGYGGFVDIVLKWRGVEIYYEVKSKEDAARVGNVTSANETQERQLNDYVMMGGVQISGLVYVAPIDTDRTVEFVHRPDVAAWEETQKQIRLLEMMRRAPERLGPSSRNARFECPGCAWRKTCERSLSPAAAMRRLERP